jgi:methylase of polypeptide subunit release factors
MTSVRPLLDPDGIARLRDALTRADFTSDGISARIGPAGLRATRRGDLRALLRATRQRDATDMLIRVFMAGQTERAAAVAKALAPLPLDTALEAGLVERHEGGIRAGVRLEILAFDHATSGGDWWVLSDLGADRRGTLHTDHVLGVNNTAKTLADATIRSPVATALDIGTGSGIQALQLGKHAGHVTATDLSERALSFAATNAALNGMEWELLRGDMLEPVAGRRFDLVVSNPPFVVGSGATRFAYRDSGRVGDAICAELAAGAPDLLTEGGTLQFLANWLHVGGEDWRERVTGWVAGTGCDAWITQRALTDPFQYVRLWLLDASEFSPRRAEEWLDWFDKENVTAVGFGTVTLRRNGHADPVVRVEELAESAAPRLGPEIAAWLDRQDWLASAGDALLDSRFRRAPGVTLTQEATFEQHDWSVSRQVLTLPSGLRWAEEVDPVTLALVSGADGSVSMRDQLAVLASAFETPEPQLAAMAAPVVAHLVERGFLLPS